MRVVAALLLLTEGAWMVFDGGRALLLGSYVTPSSGEHAGELGPWAGLVRRVGLDPLATPVKVAFVLLGIAALVVAVGLLRGTAWAWWAGIAVAVATVWYAPVGTVVAVAVVGMLMTPAVRAALLG